jgi:hypothetical protein
MEKIVKNIKLLTHFLFKRFMNVGILNSASVDRLMFKNQLFIEFINEKIVEHIYPEIKNERKKMSENSFTNLLVKTFYTFKKPSKSILLNLIHFFNVKNATLNNIKNVPFKNENLFELLNSYKYKIKKILIFPFFIYNHIQLQYILRKMHLLLNKYSLLDDYNRKTYGFTMDLHISSTFKRVMTILKHKPIDKMVLVNNEMLDVEDSAIDMQQTSGEQIAAKTAKKGGGMAAPAPAPARSVFTTKRLKYIIMDKLERYIDIRDINAKNGIFQQNLENEKSPYFTKLHAIYFLMRAIIYFEDSKMEHPKDVKQIDSEFLHKKIGLKEKLNINEEIAKYLETLKDDDNIVINNIPSIIEQNTYYTKIINELIERLVELAPSSAASNIKNGGGGGGGDGSNSKSRKIMDKIKNAYSELKNRTKKIKNATKNYIYLRFISSKQKLKFLHEINQIFYYSFEKMIDENFEKIESDLQNGEISKKRIVGFLAKTTISTFMVSHITCSFFVNFIGFISKEVPSLFLFSIGTIPINLTVQAVSCISGFVIMAQLFYFLLLKA